MCASYQLAGICTSRTVRAPLPSRHGENCVTTTVSRAMHQCERRRQRRAEVSDHAFVPRLPRRCHEVVGKVNLLQNPQQCRCHVQTRGLQLCPRRRRLRRGSRKVRTEFSMECAVTHGYCRVHRWPQVAVFGAASVVQRSFTTEKAAVVTVPPSKSRTRAISAGTSCSHRCIAEHTCTYTPSYVHMAYPVMSAAGRRRRRAEAKVSLSAVFLLVNRNQLSTIEIIRS